MAAHGDGRRGTLHHARRRAYGRPRATAANITWDGVHNIPPNPSPRGRALAWTPRRPSRTMHFCPTCSNLLLLEVRRDSTAGPDACRAPR